MQLNQSESIIPYRTKSGNIRIDNILIGEKRYDFIKITNYDKTSNIYFKLHEKVMWFLLDLEKDFKKSQTLIQEFLNMIK